MSILDHVSITVSDYERSKRFYAAALAPLGVRMIMEFGSACGFGRREKPDFWIGDGPATYQQPAQLARITPVHVAFAVGSRADVDAFWAAATAAGGRDFGRPGVRPEYHPTYYGAFVLDPDGHNVEAVCHTEG